MNDATTTELREDDEEIVVIEDRDNEFFPWTEDRDEWRRAFVFENMANPEIDVHILLQNMELALKWLKDGSVPQKEEKHLKKGQGLKSV